MKKIIISMILTLAAIAANVNAQTMVSDGEADTVSVGSQMPYAVNPDAQIKSMVDSGWLEQSQFDWKIDLGTGSINTDTTILGLYPDSILITWGTNPEDAQISVTENSIKNSEVLCTSTTTSNLNVVIVDLPELNATFDTATCGVNDYDVPVSLTGYGPWTVSYKVTYTDLASNTTDQDYINVVVGSLGNSDGTYDLPVELTSYPSAGSGKYVVTITNIDDRISLKALNDIGGTATADIQIVAAPMPNTGAIKHIEN